MIAKKRTFRPGLEILEDRCVPATLTVTKLTDGVGVPGMTLREAVLKSNGTPATDTIVFKAGLKGTITLGSQIDITNTVKINGPGAKLLKISGGGATRLFEVDDKNLSTSSIAATFSNLTLTLGMATEGGAIYSFRDDVSLKNCTLSNNVAQAAGGACRTGLGRLTIDGCRFFVNRVTAGVGGAVQVIEGALTARNSRFVGNEASNSGAAIGGFDPTTFSIDRCTIANNRSGIGSGGIAVSGGTVTISRSTIAGNSSRFGAGLSLGGAGSPSAAIVFRCTITGNTAEETGGGIRVTNRTVIVTASTLSANSAKQGGAIFCNDGGGLLLRNSTVSGNAASELGGGLYVHAAASTQTIQLSTIAFNTAQAGGGVYADRTIDLFGAIVARNSASVIGHDLEPNDGADAFNASFCLIQGHAAGLVDIGGSNILGQDPKLGVLKNNGGLTKTHALLKGSPAINKGANISPPEKFDQRGPTFKRVKAGRIDIGAFER